jgi:hypothetical protein
MPILTQPAFGPKLSIAFITAGVLLDVWILVWRYTIAGEHLTPMQRFWFYGILLSGITFTVIGIFLGNIGRAARKAEMPPTTEAVQAEAHVQAAQPTPTPVATGVPVAAAGNVAGAPAPTIAPAVPAARVS